MSEDNHQKKNHEEKQRRESTEEFCRRLGIKQVKRKGGVEFTPHHGRNLLHKRLKKASKG